MIAIVDYGIGNVGSILNMLKKIGAQAEITRSLSGLESANRFILPGVGSFDSAIKALNDTGLRGALEKLVMFEQRPILGICLGMQLLTRSSEEGREPGLGWVKAETLRFPQDPERRYRIPHMGWNTVDVLKPGGLFPTTEGELRYYFVHSYYVRCDEVGSVLAQTDHGILFHSAFKENQIFGVQFHPEKSHQFGMTILRNFADS